MPSTKTLSLWVAAVLLWSGAVAEDVCQTTTCLANGDTICDRATASCPPCMYAISGGYSCYGKVGTECPYPDTLTICPDATATTVLTPAPVATTAAPVATTAAPTTRTPAMTPAPAPSSSTDSTADSTSSAASPSSSSSSSTTKTPTPSTKPVSTPIAAAETKDAGKESPQFVNIAIIVGAAVGVLVVVVFIMRRVRQRRNMPQVDMGFDDLGFKTPDQTSSKEFTTATSTRRAANQSMYSSTQPMTDRIDFSTLEPENPLTTRTKSRHQSRRSSAAPSSIREGESMDSLEFSVGAGRSTGVSEDRHMQLPPLTRPRTKSRVRGVETSLIQNQFPELVGSYSSDVSSIPCSEQSDDFDIVDPGAIRPGERRNTETLVADGRFGQFSMASLTESYHSDATTESSHFGSSVYI